MKKKIYDKSVALGSDISEAKEISLADYLDSIYLPILKQEGTKREYAGHVFNGIPIEPFSVDVENNRWTSAKTGKTESASAFFDRIRPESVDRTFFDEHVRWCILSHSLRRYFFGEG